MKADLLAPLADARSTIGLILGLLWLVAAMVIGSVVYLTSIDRSRDFAVLEGHGRDRPLAAGRAGVPGGAALGRRQRARRAGVLRRSAPTLPMRTEVATGSYVTLAAVAVGVALVAALVSTRRTLGIDPALAFAGA